MRTMHLRSAAPVLLVLALAVVVLAIPASAATKRVATFGIECPTATRPGLVAPCWVHVEPPFFQDDAPQPTGTITVSVSSLKGTVTPSACDAAQRDCTVSYTPKGTGYAARKDTITVAYSGDSVYYGQRRSAVIAVPAELPVNMRLFCDPGTIVPGHSTYCSATVNPGTGHLPSPTGTVTFTVTNSRGMVTPTSCVLVDFSCGVSYTPTGVGTGWRKDTITASYSGDSEWGPASTTISVSVPSRQPPYLAPRCDQVETTPGVPATCWVEFGPTTSGPVPTGAVTLTVPSTRGTVTPSTCPASVTRCDFTYTPKGIGSSTRVDKITATYPGDSFWAPATGAVYVEVPAA